MSLCFKALSSKPLHSFVLFAGVCIYIYMYLYMCVCVCWGGGLVDWLAGLQVGWLWSAGCGKRMAAVLAAFYTATVLYRLEV